MTLGIIAISVLMLATSWIACKKPGKNEGIVKYDNIEE